MPLDLGQNDELHMIRGREKRNPYGRMLNPTSNAQFFVWFAAWMLNPGRPEELLPSLRQAVPSVDELYTRFPETPNLFHPDPILAALPNPPPPPDHPTLIEWLQLACLKWDPPANVHPLDPTALSGPTVDFVVARRDMIADFAPGRVLVVADTWGVCVTPWGEDRGHRLQLLTACKPNARMYELTRGCHDALLASLREHHHVDIQPPQLGGEVAQKLALIEPPSSRIKISDLWLDSRFFGSNAQGGFHPRVTMTSKHIVVRSLNHLREAGYDYIRFHHLHPGSTIEVFYFRRAIRLDIDLDPYDRVANELNLDGKPVEEVLEIIQQTLTNYTNAHGHGTHGGGGPGPHRYRDFGARGEGGGGCGSDPKRPKTDGVGTLPPTATIESARGDEERMVEFAGICGFDIDSDDQEVTQKRFDLVLPSLKAQSLLQDLGSPRLTPLLEDNLALQQPETARLILDQFIPGPPDIDALYALLTDPSTAGAQRGAIVSVEDVDAEEGARLDSAGGELDMGKHASYMPHCIVADVVPTAGASPSTPSGRSRLGAFDSSPFSRGYPIPPNLSPTPVPRPTFSNEPAVPSSVAHLTIEDGSRLDTVDRDDVRIHYITGERNDTISRGIILRVVSEVFDPDWIDCITRIIIRPSHLPHKFYLDCRMPGWATEFLKQGSSRRLFRQAEDRWQKIAHESYDHDIPWWQHPSFSG
ncbi:hypothetical protein JCM10213v2_002596 [Rhodosporidiobolus nylandii]